MNKKKRKNSHIFDGGGNFMSNASQIVGFAGMFDSIAQAGTAGIDASRGGVSNQSQATVGGVLGGQTGNHLTNMWNTTAKTREAIDDIYRKGNVDYNLNSTDGILMQYDNLGHIQHSNINTKGKELEDFAFDPASYLITRLTGLRKTAAERQNEINDAIDVANAQRDAAFINANINYDKRRKANMMYNYFDFGGPMFGMPITGASSYDIAKDNALTKQMQAQSKNSTSFSPVFSAPTAFAAGGLLSNNFTNGVSIIGNGGTHEMNPHEGVPVGIAPDGAPNLVEEGEAIFNDYVFSNRLKVPKAVRNKYKLRGPKDMTFAEAFIKAQKESEERENDPISQNGLENIAMILARTQEAVKGYNRAKGHKAAEGGHLFDGTGRSWIDYDRSLGDDFYNHIYSDESDYMKALKWLKQPENSAELNQLISDIRGGVYDNDVEKINGYSLNLDNWYRLATDHKKGPVHNALIKWANQNQGKWNPAPIAAVSEPLGEAQRAPELLARPTVVSPAEEVVKKPVVDDRGKSDVDGSSGQFDWSKLRYADILANATAVGTDLLGITNTPTVFDEIGPFQPITFNPIGNYIPVTHFDTNYETNQEAQQAAATRNAIMQSTAPARWANLLAADYNGQIAHGDLMRDAAMQDYERGVQRETFNRGTDQYNSEGALKAAMANQDARLKYNQQALMQARLNDEASTMASAAKAANFSNLMDNISLIGREYNDRQDRNWLIAKGVLGNYSEDDLRNQLGFDERTIKNIKGKDYVGISANGGKIRRKKKGLTY